MWPRRDGRGDDAKSKRNHQQRVALQCGRGAMAAVTRSHAISVEPEPELQCGRGAMAAVTVTYSSRCVAVTSFNVAAARWPR